MLGYKVAKSLDKRVVITLEIPEDAITNVKRTNIVKAETAKYRANKAKVIKIEDSDGKIYEEAVSFQYSNGTLTYKLEKELVIDNFDMNLEKVCSNGIHFFITKSLAETYGLKTIENGVLTAWHDNGTKCEETPFVNGKINGTHTRWSENGTLYNECPYVNGKRHGACYYYDIYGNKSTTVYYNGGLMCRGCCVIA